MPLVFLPDDLRFFLWDDTAPERLAARSLGATTPAEAVVVSEAGRAVRKAGEAAALLDGVAALARMAQDDLGRAPPSVAAWSLASKLALDLVVRERVVPRVTPGGGGGGGGVEARWAVSLAAPEDAARVAALARAMPPAAHAVPAAPAAAGRGRPRATSDPEVWSAEALLRAFLDAVADALARGSATNPPRPPRRPAREPWEHRLVLALTGDRRSFATEGLAERALAADLDAWVRPALGACDALRACFRLELPEGDRGFALGFLLQATDDPSLLVPAADVWKARGRTLKALGRAFSDPQEALLGALGAAARLFPPIGRALGEAKPERVALDPAEAWAFLAQAAPALGEAGLGVIVPAELLGSGQRRLRLRMRVGATSRTAGVVAGSAGLGLDEALDFRWEAALGDEALSARELAALARQKSPLVRHRGAWIVVVPEELAEIQRRLEAGGGRVPAREALEVALAGEAQVDGVAVSVVAEGALAQVIARLRSGAERGAAPPEGFAGTLRPYQARGVAWLQTMAGLGLGACLADDMGLGKTVQLLAFLVGRRSAAPGDARPTLLVAPTSVVGNWEREAARFAPALPLVRHFGEGRARSAEELAARAYGGDGAANGAANDNACADDDGRAGGAGGPNGARAAHGALVITTYSLLRRDAAMLAGVDWAAVVLDEAQNIKNAASRTAAAARALRASHRFALTGTPVENRLAELWSILEFANPGLLGPLEAFRRAYAVPIERYGNREAAERLRRVVGPFLLRRVKTDPAVAGDLPPKDEARVYCTLTREQVTLYQAALDEAMRRIEEAEGMARRGLVLALLTMLKQICNHPAQCLGEAGPLAGRSGKLARLTEMLEEALAAGDRALVFTQFREMGDRLVRHLASALDTEVAFLHGGTPRLARDEMVRRFQDEPRGPRVFVLSVKAGGAGLNLTAASHVFHFDRWWNPAVEDQATDRAHRIGQRRAVQVHKLVCAGTVEEKVDRMLEQKRDLAAQVVGQGEAWITELDDVALRELFALSGDAVAIAGELDDREEREELEDGRGDGDRGAPDGGEQGSRDAPDGGAPDDRDGGAPEGDDRGARKKERRAGGRRRGSGRARGEART
ncbi:SNF2-related protein [Sorangium sp. So ce1182]|uniref:SNF2-related protein n=1 Tax=Sorangium sp. So ce1182 TaxID=3133334 RepID=UPI003F5DE124